MSEYVPEQILATMAKRMREIMEVKDPLVYRIPIASANSMSLFVYESDVAQPKWLANKINTVKEFLKNEFGDSIKVTRVEVVDKDKNGNQFTKHGNLLIKWELSKPKVVRTRAPPKPRVAKTKAPAKKRITKAKITRKPRVAKTKAPAKPRASKQTKTTKAKSTKPAKTKKASSPKKPRATKEPKKPKEPKEPKEPKVVETQVVAPIAPSPVPIPSVPEPVIVFDKPIAIRQTPLDLFDDTDYNPIKKLIKKKKK